MVVTEPVHPDALTLLQDAGWSVEGPRIAPADALLVRTAPIAPEAVAGFGMISKHGVGVDNLPLDAARVAGVVVTNTPGANASAVAEQTAMLMLALCRRLDAQRAGTVGPVPGLEGRRLVVVGFGASGRRVATLGAAFGMEVRVVSRRPDAVRAAGFVATPWEEALATVDVLTLHCPLTPRTRHMIDRAALSRMPRGSMLIDCARGGLVDEPALIAALETGHLGGAALDVTEVEPLPPDAALRRAPNLILTPHLAAMSDGAFRRMGMMAAQNILDHFGAGVDPANVVVDGHRP